MWTLHSGVDSGSRSKSNWALILRLPVSSDSSFKGSILVGLNSQRLSSEKHST